MAEQDRGGAVAQGRGVEGGVPGVASGGFGSPFAADGHGDGVDRVEAELAQPQSDFLGSQVGAGLQAVVDGDTAGADAELGCLEREGGGEGHGVGAAGARHEHERRGPALVRGLLDEPGGPGGRLLVVEEVVQDVADRQAYRRDRRMGTHVRFPS